MICNIDRYVARGEILNIYAQRPALSDPQDNEPLRVRDTK